MKIKKDFIRIPGGQIDKDGHQVEPEGMIAQRIIPTAGPVTGSVDGQTKGNLRTEVVFEDSVLQFAQGIRRPCSTCKFYDMDSWRRNVRDIETGDDPMRKHWLNQVRAALLSTQNANVQDMHTGQDGDFDTEHAIMMLGYCKVFTELYREPIITHPLGVCPDKGPQGESVPILYQPNTKEQEREGATAYDNILRAAQSTKIK